MPVHFLVQGHVEPVLRAALKQAGGDQKQAILAALKESAADDSDDPLAKEEPAFVAWATLRQGWALAKCSAGKNGVPASLSDVVASTRPYFRDPKAEWRLGNPDRKKAYKLMQTIRRSGHEYDYRRMTRDVDAVAKEKERVTMNIKESLSMPMDFFALIICAVPAAYWIAKLSAREHWGWVMAAVAAAGIVMAEGILITIRLSKVDGWITPINTRKMEHPPAEALPGNEKLSRLLQEHVEKNTHPDCRLRARKQKTPKAAAKAAADKKETRKDR